ncbi:putative glutathione s-transferase [Rosellinia necatrix]|uniref:Putative glutathione s-transferase n=1 Tax=Rosellinia necatrix TaxID=77044 RepID=A0A1W2TF58_ROSNE|nr:putative glutathione s-transferase [Rosellinia necatrix]
MPEITLYHADGACSFVAHALLLQLGIPFRAVAMRFAADGGGLESADGSISTAAYRAISPAGYVPVLVVDGEVVTEQLAVANMIAAQANHHNNSNNDNNNDDDDDEASGFLGRDTLSRVRVVEWMAWLSGTVHAQGYGPLLRPMRFVEAGRDDVYPAIRAKGLATVEASHARIEARLTGRQHAVGDQPTVVDLFLYLLWGWGGRLAHIEDMGARYPAWEGVVRRAEALRGVREAAAREGLGLFFE